MGFFLQHRPVAPLKRARVSLTRGSSREPDYEALVVSAKPILDALVRAGVIADDAPRVIGRPEYEWEKAPRERGYVRVTVDEVEP